MHFREYQSQLRALEQERGWDRVVPSHTFVHMAEEMGEISRVLQCLEGYREATQSREELCAALGGELADLMALTCKLASQHGIDVDEAMQKHLEKFISRYHDVEQGRQEMVRYIAHQEQSLDRIKGKGDQT
jgi:NTP pyrophosphatase (non-canonical NTP hydrolase)